MSEVEVKKIQDLVAKRQKIDTEVTRLSTQREGFVEKRDELIEKLKTDHGISFEEVVEHIQNLEEERNKLLAEASKLLDQVEL